MNNKPIEISGFGAQVFAADDAWRDYCKETGIEDPFEKVREIHNRFYHYSTKKKGVTYIQVDNMTPEAKNEIQKWNEYKSVYLHKRRMWMGQYLLDSGGYDSLFAFATWKEQKEDGAFLEWFHSIKPCEGQNGECSLFCPIFANCENINVSNERN